MRTNWLFGVLFLAGCASNPYGFSRTYDALSAEDDYYERAGTVTLEDVRRTSDDLSSTMVGWFGVVTSVSDVNTSGAPTVQVQLSHRIHQERHLCTDERSSSCRVTVSERSTGNFNATLTLHAEDVEGQDRLNVGSLVKVYGTPQAQLGADGDPVINVQYYRHWPRGTYVTTASRAGMRR